MLLGVGFVSTAAAIAYPVSRYLIPPASGEPATASVIGLIIAIPGTIGFIISGLHASHRPPFSLGYVNVAALAMTIPALTLLAPIGARWAHSINVHALRKAFAVFLAATAVRMIHGLLNG